MRKIKTKIMFGMMVLATSMIFTFCQHDNEEIIPVKGPDPITHGTETLSCPNCTPLTVNGATSDFNAGNVPVGQWYFDKAHSNVMWETNYKVFGSLLTGRFNYFVLQDLNFDEANPAQIAFEGYVRLNSVNTGEPGRDGGCLLSAYGTEAAKTSEAENIARIVSVANSGRYSTTDDGFLADALFQFNGVTKNVTIKLHYFPKSDQGTTDLAAISAEFDFLALTDYAVSSTNIDDKVTIKINLTVRNKKS